MQRAEPREDRILGLQTGPYVPQDRADRLDRREGLHPPDHVAQPVIGSDGKARQPLEQGDQPVLQMRHPVLIHGGIGRMGQISFAFKHLYRIDQNRGHHRHRAHGRVIIMFGKGVRGRDQPPQVQMRAQKRALRQPRWRNFR